MFRLTLMILAFGIAASQLAQAQEYHQFTSKDGRQISAELLGISPDNRKATIRREDNGEEFQYEIVGLSLDDQQYIKNWLKTRVIEVKTDYRLEVDLDYTLEDSERHRRDSYNTYEQRFGRYEIVCRNLSRENLPGAILEYVVVWKERIRVYESAEGGWTYASTGFSAEDPMVKVSGFKELGEMAYNRDVEVFTKTVEINRAFYDGKVIREDDLVGVKVRIKDTHGNILLEQDSAGSEIENISWEGAVALRDAVKDT